MEIAMRKTEEFLEPRIRTVFRQTAQYIFDRIQRDDFKFESQSHNLLASIGIGVFKDGVLTDWIANPYVPAELKKFKYKGTVYDIDGQQALNEALGAIDVKGMGKWVMVLVAAVPYALFVDLGLGTQRADGMDKRGMGWWSDDFAPSVAEAFRTSAIALVA